MFTLCNEIEITTEPIDPVEILPNSEEIVVTSIGTDCSEENDESMLLTPPVQAIFTSGVHFLSHESLLTPKLELIDDNEVDSEMNSYELTVQGRRDLLEYLIQDDGTVVCKWCGEVLPSRTHWYRHKYKLHVSSPPGTANLFKCYRCNVFFKSRKGYVGHCTSRHSSDDNDLDGINSDNNTDNNDSATDNKTNLDSSNNLKIKRSTTGNIKQDNELEVYSSKIEEYEKQREREEKLVAEIIDRVKKECEAQGSTVTRRGYSRRTTVMNT